MFAELPPRSPLSRPLLARVTAGLDVPQAAALAGRATRTVARARAEHVEESEHDLAFLSNAKHKEPKRIGDGERKAIEAWIKGRCPCKSGSKYHIQRCTSQQLYEEYKQALASGELRFATPDDEEPKTRARCVFDTIKHALGIRAARSYSGNFECLLCAALAEEQRALVTARARWEKEVKEGGPKAAQLWVDLDATEQRVKKLQAHNELKLHQAAYLHHVRHVATKQDRTRVLVVMDFSKYNTKPAVSKAGKDVEWIHDLIMVVEWWPSDAHPAPSVQIKPTGLPIAEKRCIKYIDNLCEQPGVEKNDTEYVRVVLRRIIQRGDLDGFRRVDLFTDGGGKHFKNVYSMEMSSHWVEMWHELRGKDVLVPELVWNVTAPYHGHGTADSHAGSVSQHLNRTQLKRQHIGGLTAPPPGSVHEFKVMIDKMKNCAPEVFESIDRPEARADMESLAAGIKK